MQKISQCAGLLALLCTVEGRADVGPDYVCQHKVDTTLPEPKGTIEYWTDIATSWTNFRSGDVEVFVRGPGLVMKDPLLMTEAGKEERWLVPPKVDFPAQGVYLTFTSDECVSVEGKVFYCARNRQEESTAILVAGRDENGRKRQYRETLVQAKSVQAVLAADQFLVTFVMKNGKRVTLSESCTSKEWYPHIPKDELNRTDIEETDRPQIK